MPTIPSTTATITVGNVGTTLGNATKNMGGFRGFGGSVPASGSISMSQCQKIQYGVGYVDAWSLLNTTTNRGTWGDTGITNGSSKTVSVWVYTAVLNGNWRNVFHVTSDGGNCCGIGQRAPSWFIFPSGTTIHGRHSTLADGNAGLDGGTITVGSVVNLVGVYTATGAISMYKNGSFVTSAAMGSAWYNQISTAIVYAPPPWDTYGDVSIAKLWFFPYAMTAAQVSSYYSSLSGTIGSPAFVLSFTSPGSWTSTVTGNIKVLVVAGGGQGGPGANRAGGGGGAGGVVYCTSFPVTNGTSYPYTVGGGGSGQPGTANQGNSGSPSTFSSITGIGGGGGEGAYSPGLPGGSGGGGGQDTRAGGGTPNPAGTGTQPGQGQPANCTNYGNPGAIGGYNGTFGGGGGGGAGGAGSPTGGNPGGPGGAGVSISITGSAVTYAGGGAGATQPGGTGGTGGSGGGGPAASNSGVGGNATYYGGAGGAGASGFAGGSGFQGIVIIAYP